MEEAGGHVDVRARSGTRPSAPPHHRHGYLEGQHNDRAGSAGSMLPRLPRLPRVRVNPDTPKFPVIPKPDYSPPVRRATGKMGPPQRTSVLERY